MRITADDKKWFEALVLSVGGWFALVAAGMSPWLLLSYGYTSLLSLLVIAVCNHVAYRRLCRQVCEEATRDFFRTKLREDGFMRRCFPPTPVDDFADLDDLQRRLQDRPG